MKNNTLTVLLTTIAVSAISLIGFRMATGTNLLPTLAVAVSYVAVAVLVALAAVDYRVGPKNYSSR